MTRMIMNKVKKETVRFYLLSFILPFAATMLIFIISRIYPFGDTTFLRKDFYQQYTPFFYEFYNKLKKGESLFYSWKAGIGANFFAIYVYYLASPFNFLSLLLPEKYILEFMTYMVVIKTGFMGLTFSHYLRRHFGREEYSICLFGMAYAFSGFMAAYNWNVMWMDVLFLAPLVILGLEYIHEGGKPYLYCIALAFSIYTNYYLSIMLCIYLLIDFIALSLKKGLKPGSFVRFGWYSLLAGAFGAVLMLPELAALQFTSFTSSKFPTEVVFYMQLPEIFARHLIAVATETGLDHWPNIYCGLFTVFLLSLYFATRKVLLREKIVNLFVIAFFILSYNLNQLNYIWHGLNYPDSLPARQSYLYIIFLLTLSYEGFIHIRDSGRTAFYLSMSVAFAGIVTVLFLSHDDALSKDTLIFNLSFGIAWFAFFTICRAVKNNLHDIRMIYTVILTFMAVELIANQYYTNGHSISRKDYFKSFEAYRKLNEKVEDMNGEADNPLGRVDEIKRKIRNDSMMIGFSSLSCFSSTNNGLIKKYCDRYGLENSRVFYLNEGVTPVSAALMGQHYTLLPENASWSADDIAEKIVLNAKGQRPSVCNAEEVLLVHRDIAEDFLPLLQKRLCGDRAAKGLPPVELRADRTANALLHATPAGERDFDTEFLDYILAVKLVENVEEAIGHISEHHTGHSDCIVTEDPAAADLFTACVDSAAVYVNASTRFTDGGEFGLGCEMGISTQKLHARGPMGLEELCTYKYIVRGNGQIR